MRTIKEIMRSYAVFNSEGIHIGGSDKESNHHYGDVYESLFTDKHVPYDTRRNVSLVMEVGVTDGSCLLAWRDVFPHAQIVGMDIHPSYIAQGCVKERIEFHLGDQRSRADCERAVAGRQFDLIVEDATHVLENTLLTLLFLWPHIRPGGLYVVEEWADIGGLRANVAALWPQAEVVGTCGPRCEDEPLVVFRKTL